MDEEEALRIMREGEGGHFDPSVLDAFLRRLDDIRAVRAGVARALADGATADLPVA